MGLIIDTKIFIDAERGRIDLSSLSALEDQDDTYIAAITASELLTGVHLAGDPGTKIRRSAFVEGILSNMPMLDFNEEVARVYAEIYSYLIKPRSKKQGSVHDYQIAATAMTYGLSVLTSNVEDFKIIPGLILETPKIVEQPLGH